MTKTCEQFQQLCKCLPSVVEHEHTEMAASVMSGDTWQTGTPKAEEGANSTVVVKHAGCRDICCPKDLSLMERVGGKQDEHSCVYSKTNCTLAKCSGT